MMAIVGTAVLFGIAHIDLKTFSIPWFQVCYAFTLGLAYGLTFVGTKSIIYPMIMHSISNVISVDGWVFSQVTHENILLTIPDFAGWSFLA